MAVDTAAPLISLPMVQTAVGPAPADRTDYILVSDRADVPEGGRVFRVRREDQLENPWPGDYSPKRVRSVLNAQAAGLAWEAHQAFDQMLEADPKLPGIYETRLNAIRNRPWEVVSTLESQPTPQKFDAKLAKDVADYCRETLMNIEGFDDTLGHLLDAIGRSVAAAEIVWRPEGKGHIPAALVEINHRSIVGDTTYPWMLRVRTNDHPFPGVPISGMPNKFIIHAPRPIGKNPFRGGTHRICLPLNMMRRYGGQWWVSALEFFGVPYRKGTYPANANADDKAAMEKALRDIAFAGYGAFPADAELEFLTTMNGSERWPHQTFVEHIDECYAILLLGQTLTTNATDKGTQALGTVQDRVRIDVRDADIAREGATIRRDLLTPMVRLAGFPPDAPIPYFRRTIEEVTDTVKTLNVIDGAVNRLGMKIPAGHAYAKLDIPIPADVPPASFLDGMPATVDPFGFGGPRAADDETEGDDTDDDDDTPPGGDKPGKGDKKAATATVPAAPGPQRPASPLGVLAGWINHAVAAARKQVLSTVAHCADAIGDATAASEAKYRLARSVATLPQSEFSAAIGDYMVAAAFAGAYVGQRRIDAKRGKAMAAAGPFDPFAKPFREAISALGERIKLAPDEFLKLERAARSRAGRIAGQYNLRLVEDVYGVIEDVLTDGGTAYDFRAAVRAMPAANGWVDSAPWHANLVFGQNAAMSFNAGNYASMQAAGVTYWQFRTYIDVDDQNPCPICRPFDGLIFADADRKYYPPTHFNCRCYADPVFDDEIPAGGPARSGEIQNPEYEMSQKSSGAFRYDPAHFARQEPLDLSVVAPELRAAFGAYAADKGWAVK